MSHVFQNPLINMQKNINISENSQNMTNVGFGTFSTPGNQVNPFATNPGSNTVIPQNFTFFNRNTTITAFGPSSTKPFQNTSATISQGFGGLASNNNFTFSSPNVKPSKSNFVFGLNTQASTIQPGFSGTTTFTFTNPVSTMSTSGNSIFSSGAGFSLDKKIKTNPIFGSPTSNSPFHNTFSAPTTQSDKTILNNPFLFKSGTSSNKIVKEPLFTVSEFSRSSDKNTSLTVSPKNKTNTNITFSHKNIFNKSDFRPEKPVSFKQTASAAENKDVENNLLNRSRSIHQGRLFSKALQELHRTPSGSRKYENKPQEHDSKVFPSKKDIHTSSKRERRTASAEEINNITMILCKGIPNDYNNKMFLTQHFKRFGRIIRLTPNIRKMQATINFATHDAAENAKRNGKILQPGNIAIDIFWMQQPPTQRFISEEMQENKELMKELKELGEIAEVEEGTNLLERPRHRLRSGSNQSKSSQEVQMKNWRAASLVSKARMAVARQTSQTRSSSERSHSSSKEIISDFKMLWEVLKNKVTYTSEERFNILDKRDKILRKLFQKSFKKSKTSVIVGICPDMCPEKERYFRDSRRQVHYYEIFQGDTQDSKMKELVMINHSAAVKEYSRSSADQPLPLPNELRPISVLKLTMDYLLIYVVERYDETKVLEWYDFLWNRTRAIRKDITQQHFCNLDSVDLVEKCARFHIHCAEFLCEEEMNIFDAKINNENLTKCLQTLKHFYEDLAQENIFCPNEVEFRAYDILLNINQGNILLQVQYFRPAVRESPEVQFALQVFFAINSNNYVRFFKLVRVTSYLNACILHRYFTQVRTKALNIMLRAHCLSGHPVNYPLDDFVELLAFENSQEAKSFCQHYGLQVDDGQISFNRSLFVIPEEAFSLWRAEKLIENKRTVSVGEVIYGDSLPTLSDIPVSSSFDKNGYFIEDFPSDVNALFVTDKTDKSVQKASPPSVARLSPVAVPSSAPPPPVPDNQKQIEAEFKIMENTAIKEFTQELFIEVINEMCVDVASKTLQMAQFINGFGNELLDSLVTEIIRELSKNILSDEHLKFQKQKAAEELMKTRELVINSFLDDILEKYVVKECRKIAEEQMRLVNEELFQQSQDNATAALANEYLDCIFQEEVKKLAQEIHFTNVVLKEKLLEEKIVQVKKQWGQRALTHWRKVYMKQLRLWNSMLAFPSCPGFTSLKNLTEQFPVQKNWDLPSVLPFSSLVFQDDIKAQVKNYQKRHTEMWQPLNLASLVGKTLSTAKVNKFSSVVYWKLLVSLPELEDNNPVIDWIKAKLEKGGSSKIKISEKVDILSQYTCNIPCTEQSMLKICIRAVRGCLTDDELVRSEEHYLFLGTSAILLILIISAEEMDVENWWLENRLRLFQLVTAKPLCPPLPLMIIIFGERIFSEEEIITHLQLSELLHSELIDNVQIDFMACILDSNSSHQLSERIQWLAEHQPDIPTLARNFLKDELENMLTAFFFTPAYQNLADRLNSGMHHQNPSILIDLYNSIIIHIYSVITNDELNSLSWPVAEFSNNSTGDLPLPHWNSQAIYQHIGKLLNNLLLPEFTIDTSLSWDDICESIWLYLELIVAKGEQECVSLISRINWLLSRVQQSNVSSNFDENVFKLIPWLDVIDACISYLLSCQNYQDPLAKEQELSIFYREENMKQFRFPLSWIEAGNTDSPNDARAQKRKSSTPDIYFEEHNPSKLYFKVDDTSPINYTTKQACHQLKTFICFEKQQSEMFLQKLQKWLEPSSDTHSPLSLPSSPFHILNGSFQEQLDGLQNEVSASKIADKQFENKLQYLMQD